MITLVPKKIEIRSILEEAKCKESIFMEAKPKFTNSYMGYRDSHIIYNYFFGHIQNRKNNCAILRI